MWGKKSDFGSSGAQTLLCLNRVDKSTTFLGVVPFPSFAGSWSWPFTSVWCRG